jgi:hypothetical protein
VEVSISAGGCGPWRRANGELASGVSASGESTRGEFDVFGRFSEVRVGRSCVQTEAGNSSR